MILRRLARAFRRQDWFTVFVETMIVVLGVFLGLQVNNWNEARKDARRGDDFALRLIADLEKDLGNRSQLADYYDAVNEGAVRATELLENPAPDPKALVINAYRATEYAYDPQTRATWEEIVSAGDIGLLPGEATGQLAEYFGVDTADQTRQEIINSRVRLRVRSAIPHKVQAAIRADCGDMRAENNRVVGFNQACALSVSDAEIAAAAAVLSADAQLPGDLALQISTLTGARANLRGDIYMIRQAIDRLRGDRDMNEAAP